MYRVIQNSEENKIQNIQDIQDIIERNRWREDSPSEIEKSIKIRAPAAT